MKLFRLSYFILHLGFAWILGLGGSTFATTKIVTTSPSVTELIYQLGYGDQIVAASHLSDYPSEAKRLPRVGSLFLPNLEGILKFSPDWVLVDSESSPKDFLNQLAVLQIKSSPIAIRSVNDLFQESEKILSLVFQNNDFSPVEKHKQQFQDSKKQLHKRFNFLVLAWPSPIILVGRNTFLSDLLTQLGGTNLLKTSLNASYPQVADEWIIRNRPDVLFVLGDSEKERLQTKARAKFWWPKKNFPIILLPSEFFARTTYTPLVNISHIWSEIP